MLAFALVLLATPDLTLEWTTGERSRDAMSSTTTWAVKDNLLTQQYEHSGRAQMGGAPEPKKPVALNAEQQKQVNDLLGACDKLEPANNDKAAEGRFTSILLRYGPKKKTVSVVYDFDVTERMLRPQSFPPDSPDRAKAFAAVNALNDYFMSLMPAL